MDHISSLFYKNLTKFFIITYMYIIKILAKILNIKYCAMCYNFILWIIINILIIL
jgi:hypothetical protein